MSDPKFKIADNITTHGPTAFVQGENATGNQYIGGQASENKMDVMLTGLKEQESKEMESLAGDVLKFFMANFDKLGPGQQAKVEEAKKGGWKGKIKLALPFVDIEAEKEFEAGAVMSSIRNRLYGDEIIALNLLNG